MTQCDEAFEEWRSEEDWTTDYNNAQFYRAERAWDAAWAACDERWLKILEAKRDQIVDSLRNSPVNKCDEAFEKFADAHPDECRANSMTEEWSLCMWRAAWQTGYNSRQAEVVHILNSLLQQQGKLHGP